MTVRLVIEFADSVKLAEWVEAARVDGLLPESAGIRQADSLDVASHRARPGDHILASDPGIAAWLVPPPSKGPRLHVAGPVPAFAEPVS